MPPPILTSTPADALREQQQSRRATLITLGVIVALVALVALLTPVTDDGDETRLTTRSYAAGGARLTADLARRLGWRTSTRDLALSAPLDTAVIYAVFDGPVRMRAAEVGALLAAVRGGASLMVAPAADGSSPILDSLQLEPRRSGPVDVHPLGDCPAGTDALGALRIRTHMLTFDTTTRARGRQQERRARPLPPGSVTLLSSRVEPEKPGDAGVESIGGSASDSASGSASGSASDSTRDSTGDSTTAPGSVMRDMLNSARASTVAATAEPTVIAFPFGRGRIVALADPDVLRTAQVRSCPVGSALTAVRALEYLSPTGRRPVVFAEYYQTARTDGPTVVVREWLTQSRLGRAVLTLCLAGLVLLVARGRRTLAPVYHEREERRSALEHVDALATAWRAVRGTRTVARQLARGIRRRHAAGRWRTLNDTAFLAALAERHPAIAGDAARLTDAIDTPVTPAELPALRTAAAHIDAECLTP